MKVKVMVPQGYNSLLQLISGPGLQHQNSTNLWEPLCGENSWQLSFQTDSELVLWLHLENARLGYIYAIQVYPQASVQNVHIAQNYPRVILHLPSDVNVKAIPLHIFRKVPSKIAFVCEINDYGSNQDCRNKFESLIDLLHSFWNLVPSNRRMTGMQLIKYYENIKNEPSFLNLCDQVKRILKRGKNNVGLYILKMDKS